MYNRILKNFIAKITSAGIYLVLCCLLCVQANAQIKELDKIAVIVDDQVITDSELATRLGEIVNRSQNANVNLPPKEILTKQVVDLLIVEKLQLGMAERFDVKAKDEEVINTIKKIMQQRGWDQAGLEAHLKNEQSTMNEFVENIRRELTMQTISQGVVNRRISISDLEINNFLKSADAKFWISPDYRLSHILIGLPSSPSTEDIQTTQEKANKIFIDLKDGANFTETAITYSNGQAALEGGDLGWRKSSQLPTLFAEIVTSLKVGEISKPIRSQAGFHILKVIETRGNEKQIVNQTKARHILIKTSAIMDDDSAQKKLTKIKQDILEGASFSEIAKDISEDIGTRMAGGDLGWTNPGTFVPAFETAMKNSAINEITDPFKSRFGWHILQVIERRDEDLTDLALRGKARNILSNRRFADEKQIWIQEMRDDAFVHYKIPGFEDLNEKIKTASAEDLKKLEKKKKKKRARKERDLEEEQQNEANN